MKAVPAMDSKKCSEFRLVSKKKLDFPSPSGRGLRGGGHPHPNPPPSRGRALNRSSDRIGKKAYRAICGPGPLFSATSFNDPLDSGFANSYLFMGTET
jgi:hypothetical protein